MSGLSNLPGLSSLSGRFGDAFNTFSNGPIGQAFAPLRNNIQQSFDQFGRQFPQPANPQVTQPQVSPQLPQMPLMPQSQMQQPLSQNPAAYQQALIAGLMRGRQ